jgi:isohexenylglutaconyl-CoA hydratase
MMLDLPQTQTLSLAVRDGVLWLTLDRPERKNAMNGRMLQELIAVFDALDAADDVRAVVLRGAGGSFCAGADIKDMAAGAGSAPGGDARAASAQANRRFGVIAERANGLRQPLVGVIEGAVMGGGFGLACVTDIALAHRDARFGLPETGLGLIPAQIAPFVVQRIGLTQARRLMLTGARIDGAEALRVGLVHALYDSTQELDAGVADVLAKIQRCAPGANAATKRLIQRVVQQELDAVLDYAAELFAEAALGDEGREGARAFVEKRLPSWAKG